VVYSIGHLLDDFHGFDADGADSIGWATVDLLQADRGTLLNLSWDGHRLRASV
jgi:hypothetical protein